MHSERDERGEKNKNYWRFKVFEDRNQSLIAFFRLRHCDSKRIRKEEEKINCAANSNKMVPMEPRFLIFGVAVVFLARVTGTETRDPLAAAFYSLNGEERNDFLNYFLAVGLRDWTLSQPRPPKFLGFNEPQVFVSSLNISKASAEKFENMNIPKESVRKLLEWTKSEFNLSTRNIAELVRHKKSSGRVRFPDIGELCCPW